VSATQQQGSSWTPREQLQDSAASAALHQATASRCDHAPTELPCASACSRPVALAKRCSGPTAAELKHE